MVPAAAAVHGGCDVDAVATDGRRRHRRPSVGAVGAAGAADDVAAAVGDGCGAVAAGVPAADADADAGARCWACAPDCRSSSRNLKELCWICCG